MEFMLLKKINAIEEIKENMEEANKPIQKRKVKFASISKRQLEKNDCVWKAKEI